MVSRVKTIDSSHLVVCPSSYLCSIISYAEEEQFWVGKILNMLMR